MSKNLKFTLILHTVLAVLFGLPLLGMPGRFLGYFGWAPIDPLISRMLGAALLSMAWIDWRALRTNSRPFAQASIEAGTVFCGLAAVGLARNMLGAGWPLMAWLVLGLFVILAALWLWNWLKR